MDKRPLSETPKFQLLMIDNMECKDCANKGAGKSGICDIYPNGKPLEVIQGGGCKSFVGE